MVLGWHRTWRISRTLAVGSRKSLALCMDSLVPCATRHAAHLAWIRLHIDALSWKRGGGPRKWMNMLGGALGMSRATSVVAGRLGRYEDAMNPLTPRHLRFISTFVDSVVTRPFLCDLRRVAAMPQPSLQRVADAEPPRVYELARADEAAAA